MKFETEEDLVKALIKHRRLYSVNHAIPGYNPMITDIRPTTIYYSVNNESEIGIFEIGINDSGAFYSKSLNSLLVSELNFEYWATEELSTSKMWERKLETKNVLCWVSNSESSSKMLATHIVSLTADGSFVDIDGGLTYKYATPVTPEELEQDK